MFCMRYITVQFHWRLYEVPILVLQAVREIAIMCFAPFLSSFKWFCMRYITVHFHWRLFQSAGGIANNMFVCARKSVVKDLNATDDGKECDENVSFWVVVLNPWCKISGKLINFWADGLHSGCLDLKVYWIFFGLHSDCLDLNVYLVFFGLHSDCLNLKVQLLSLVWRFI